MAKRDIIVMGASAGGIEVLQEVIAGLPAELAATVLVVVHMPPSGGHALSRILGKATDLDVREARDGDPLAHGVIYTARGDHHLLVGSDHVHVRRGPRENGHRPAVDPLFRSAAAYHGARVIGVVLTGSLSDGTAGLHALRRRGGLAVVQDPASALYPGMPTSALDHVGADHVAEPAEIGALLGRLTADDPEPGPEGADGPERAGADPLPDPVTAREVRMMEVGDEAVEGRHPGRPSPWPCPDCNGVLWEIEGHPVLRFRCRVGHAWSADALLHQQGVEVEQALWMALRSLEDRAALSRRLAERAEAGARPYSAGRYREDLGAVAHSIEVLRRLLASEPAQYEDDGEEDEGEGEIG